MSTRRRLAVSLVAAAAVAGAIPLFVGAGTSGAAPAPAGCPTTPGYGNTIPTPVGPPTTVSFTDTNNEGPDTVGYAAIGSDKKLYFYQQSIQGTAGDFDVSPLFCFGGQATDSPAVTYDGTNTLGLFVRAASGTLYQRYLDGESDTSSIGAYTPVNGASTTNGPAAVVTPDGQYHLFVRGTNGALYHGFRQNASLSSWRFEKIGGAIVGAPTAIVDGNRILIAAVGTNGTIYTVRGTNFAWGPFTKVVNQVSGNSPTQVTTKTTPSLVRNPDTGAITMYAAYSGYGLFAITKAANAGFTGSLWFRLDSLLPSDARIAAATDGPDSIVYARFLDRPSGQTVTAYTQYSADTGQWSDYYLAPYSCYNCAPFDVTNTAAGKAAGKASVSGAKVLPGKLVPMPKTKKVLG